jgi:methylmalonyl-CoA mutase N-terminal domain/subunit
MLRFHAQTAGSTLTAQQVDNNVVRVALQALAAAMGGAQSLHTNGRDEALALPTENAARLALRTQQIIAHESGIADVIDPLGGSYAIEALTDELEAKAEEYIRKIDEMGGMVEAISKGYPQSEIQNAAYEAQRALEDGRQVVVGVNQFQMKESAPTDLLRVNEEVEKAQVLRLKELRARRHNQTTLRTINALRDAAKREDENLVPFIYEAVKAEATLGEISDALREVFGEHKENVVL